MRYVFDCRVQYVMDSNEMDEKRCDFHREVPLATDEWHCAQLEPPPRNELVWVCCTDNIHTVWPELGYYSTQNSKTRVIVYNDLSHKSFKHITSWRPIVPPEMKE